MFEQNKISCHMAQSNLRDECWNLLTACLHLDIFNCSTDLKRIQTSHHLFRDFGANKNVTTCWSGGRVQVWIQVWALASQLAITPEDYSRRQSKVLNFWLLNEWPTSLGSTLAQLGRVRWVPESTNTGNFWVSGSHGWQQPAHLKKTCFHSCNTDSGLESKMFWSFFIKFDAL